MTPARGKAGRKEAGSDLGCVCARAEAPELGLVGEDFSEEEAIGAGLLSRLVPVKQRIGDLEESLPLLQKELWGFP